jgi:hypothetical protein
MNIDNNELKINDFIINLELLVEMKVYVSKQKAKDKLLKFFQLNTDYIIIKKLIQNLNKKARQAGKNKENIMLTTDCFKSICLLSNKRSIISEETKQELKNNFDIILDTKIRLLPIETETIIYIMKVFKNELMETQYQIGKYRIDLYFLMYKLSIECNENNHEYYNQDNEIKRKKYIENKLQCSFITYNPDEKDFCIFNVINLIFEHIKKTF